MKAISRSCRCSEHFLREFAVRYGREPAAAPPDLLAAARAYPWPGNVRELRNLCERAVLMGWPAVAPILTGAARPPSSLAALVDLDAPLLEARAGLVERFEREYLVRLLQQHRARWARWPAPPASPSGTCTRS